MPIEKPARFEKLKLPERPYYIYSYYVTGREGSFPYDMLRYDASWPATSEDASKLYEHERSSKLFSIKMHSYREPTVDRWSSFGWSVGLEKLGA